MDDRNLCNALKIMSTVYVGAIPRKVNQYQIRNLFAVYGPIKMVNMPWNSKTNHHMGYSFVEYAYPDAAYQALEAMHNYLIEGSCLKLSHPASIKNHAYLIDPIIKKAMDHYRIYFTSAGQLFPREAIMETFNRYGDILELKLLEHSKPFTTYGYITYSTEDACKEAILSKNNVKEHGRFLHVSRAITSPGFVDFKFIEPINLHTGLNFETAHLPQPHIPPIITSKDASSNALVEAPIDATSEVQTRISKSDIEVPLGPVNWPRDVKGIQVDLQSSESINLQESYRKSILEEVRSSLRPEVDQLCELYLEKVNEYERLMRLVKHAHSNRPANRKFLDAEVQTELSELHTASVSSKKCCQKLDTRITDVDVIRNLKRKLAMEE